MKVKQRARTLFALFLVISMLGQPVAMAVEAMPEEDVRFEQVDNDRVTASLVEEEEPIEEDLSLYAPTDMVRVAIFLEEESTLEYGYSTYGIASNRKAMNYRQRLLENQYSVTNVIERRIGETLDVQWNLTLVTNAISANVEYGQIEEIARTKGVKEVAIEMQYTPAVLLDSEGEYDPQMAISTDMTGMTQVFSNGYTGAGTRVAIIDTGLDLDHQSFDGDALKYAFQQTADEQGVELEDYMDSLNLLGVDELAEKLGELNVAHKYNDDEGILEEDSLYKSIKVPFAFNYVDASVEYVDHNRDSQTDHGSHVAGIAAANRYVKNNDGGFDNALTSCKVVGNAPDAQLLVMKVFGMSGGGTDSDIVAAIEDAIMLGADSVNMSLGNSMPYFTAHSAYTKAYELLKDTDTVMVVAVGNEGAWPDYANTEAQLGGGSGLLYTEDVQMGRVASPASLTESLAVASVQNHGMISNALFGVIDDETGEEFFTSYNEQIYNEMKPLSSLDTSDDESGTDYEFVFIDGYGDPNGSDLDFIDVEGKVVFIQRGMQIAFSDKAAYAVENGAIATIIYDNVEGSSGMDMSAYPYEEPAVMVTKAVGDKIRSMATPQEDLIGNTYYTGTVKVISTVRIVKPTEDYYTMSSFSDWGTTSDLALKPEITAPGGNIYSVNGSVEDTDQYKLNSGTSMAAPQVAGVVATLKQYIREAGITEEYSEFSERQLIQSLLMSTALPMKDGDGNYYSLLQQGVGLVNGQGAVSAESFIMMDEDYLTDKGSGKVKAEVGDDPERTGVYEFYFDLYNTGETDKTFNLFADVFAQDYVKDISAPDSGYKAEYMSKSTIDLSSYAEFRSEGKSQRDGSITVPAGEMITVEVSIELQSSAISWLEKHYPNGTYIQAFVYVEPEADEEGVKTATHSIAMLGYYGNWTDATMYDGPSYYEGEVVANYSTPNTTDHSRMPYIEDYMAAMNGESNVPFYGGNHVKIAAQSGDEPYAFGGNPLVKEEYRPERNATKNGAYIGYWQYWLIRASDEHYWAVTNKTTGEIYKEGFDDQNILGAYYHLNAGAWIINEQTYAGYPNTIFIDYTLPQLEEGTEIEVSLTHLPEYYAEGKLGEGKEPGEGATLRMSAVIDEIGPVVSDIQYNADGTLDITAVDTNYIAAVVLYTEDGKRVISYTGSKDEIEKGEAAVYTVDAGVGDNAYLLQVYDYAKNAATYLVEVDASEMIFNGNLLAYDLDTQNWVNVSRYSEKLEAVTRKTAAYTAATAVGDTIYAIAYGTDLYKLSVTDPSETEFIAELPEKPVDMAYNPVDGRLYAVTEESLMLRINPDNGDYVTIGQTPIVTNTLACDSNGVFYSNGYGSGGVFAYTLDAMKKGNAAYDLSGDGILNDIDVQVLLEYVTGVRSVINNRTAADLDGDGDIDTYDAHLLYEKMPGSVKLIATLGFSSKYMQAMECDPNNGTLYWASYSVEHFDEQEIGFSVLYGIDTVTGEVTRYNDVSDQLSSLLILDKHMGSIYEPIGGAANLENAEDKFYDNEIEQSGVAYLMGVDNCAKEEYLAAANESQPVSVVLKASKDAANGLYTVEYDPAMMTFRSWQSEAGLVSVKENEGLITFGYAGKKAVAANEVTAQLTFETEFCESKASVTLMQLNNTHFSETTEYEAGAHEWSAWTVTGEATCTSEGEKSRTCSKCEAVERQIIPADASAHVWNEGTVLKAAGENEPGVQLLTCDCCNTEKREWIMPFGATLTEAEATAINSVYINEKYITAAQLVGAGIDKAYRISTIDGSIRHLVYLSADTDWESALQVLISSYYDSNGIGYAIKGENIYDRVDALNGDSKLEYKFELQDGLGSVKCWSYAWEASTEFAFYFVVGEQSCGDGAVTFVTASDGKRIGIRGAEQGVSSDWLEPGKDGDSNVIKGKIRLDASTSLDAELVLEFPGNNRQSLEWKNDMVYLCTEDGIDETVDLTLKGLRVKLEKGAADVRVYMPSGNTYYDINIVRRSSNAPVLHGSSNGSAAVALGEAYTVDLSTLFTDSDLDALTYTVSVDGGEPKPAEQQFVYTPEAVGSHLLEFRASDGVSQSEAYTLVLTARAGGVLLGDVNGDGKVNAKDATVFRRALAPSWDVTIVEAAADVNGDLVINNKDVAYLIRYLAGWDGYSLH